MLHNLEGSRNDGTMLGTALSSSSNLCCAKGLPRGAACGGAFVFNTSRNEVGEFSKSVIAPYGLDDAGSHPTVASAVKGVLKEAEIGWLDGEGSKRMEVERAVDRGV